MHPELADPSDYIDYDADPITYYPNGSHLDHWGMDPDELHAEITVLSHELRETNLPESVFQHKALELVAATERLFAYLAAGGRFPGGWAPF